MSWGTFPLTVLSCGVFSLDMKRLVSLDCSHPKGIFYPRGGFSYQTHESSAYGQYSGEQQSPVREAVTLGAAASEPSRAIHALFSIGFTAWID